MVFIVNLVWAVLALLGILVIKDEAMPEIPKAGQTDSTDDDVEAEEEEDRRRRS